MNQRVENELRSILDDLEKGGLLEKDLIADCLKKDGIRIPRLSNKHSFALICLVFISLGYFGFFYAGLHSSAKENILIKRDVPASVGRDKLYTSLLKLKSNAIIDMSNDGIGITVIMGTSMDLFTDFIVTQA